jgi:hypothetical protein
MLKPIPRLEHPMADLSSLRRALVAVAGTLWFQIPFVGNPFGLLIGASLYLLSVLGIGLLISTVCAT